MAKSFALISSNMFLSPFYAFESKQEFVFIIRKKNRILFADLAIFN